MEKNKLDKLIFGTAPDKSTQRSDLPPVRDLSPAFHKAVADEGSELPKWFERILEKFEQYRLEFNRALSDESLTIASRSVDDTMHEFSGSHVALRIQLTTTSIGFLIKLGSESLNTLAEFENESESDSPVTLRFEGRDFSIKNLSEPLRRIFGLFIEALTDSLEKIPANETHSEQSIITSECQPTNGETSMLQTKEFTLIDSLDNVRHSVERELVECAREGAKAFETRDMQAIQGAAARMDRVQNLKTKIDATVGEWIRELTQ